MATVPVDSRISSNGYTKYLIIGENKNLLLYD